MTSTAPDVINSPERLEAVYQAELLDKPAQEAFERLVYLASQALNAPVTLVTLLDDHRQFFISSRGLPAELESRRETPIAYSICQYVVSSGEPLIIGDARANPLVEDNPAVKEFGVIAYAGLPLKTGEGHALGSFCAIDRQPREWSREEIDILQALTNLAISEIEWRRTAHRVRDSKREMEAVELLRDDLTNMIIHDLRTPLHSIMLGLQMLKMAEGLSLEQHEFLAISERSSRSLLRMINNLLDIHKIETGSMRLEVSDLDAANLMASAISAVQALAHYKRLSLSIQTAPSLPGFQGDAELLARVLINLLGNAIQCTPEDGSIRVSAALAPDEKSLEFSVSDTGIGVLPQDAERIFEKFTQLRSGCSAREMSSGLGLTFCKMVVEAHGGHIHVESGGESGSTFVFTLPLNRSSQAI